MTHSFAFSSVPAVTRLLTPTNSLTTAAPISSVWSNECNRRLNLLPPSSPFNFAQTKQEQQLLQHHQRVHRRLDTPSSSSSSASAPTTRACYTSTAEAVKVTQRVPPDCVRKFYDWNGYRCSYIESTGCEATQGHVVLVHGFGGSAAQYRNTITAGIAAKLQILAVDLLGFGASDKPCKVEYSIELWSAQLDDFCMRFASSPVVFVGNSIGSLTALHATKAMGEARVGGVALMNTAGGLVSFRLSELPPLQRVLLRVFNAVLFNDLVGGLLFRWLRKRENLRAVLQQVYVNHAAVDDELVDIVGAPAYTPGAQQVFLRVLNADAGPKPEPLLENIVWCPVLCAWGEQDVLTPLRTGMHPGIELAKYHPNFVLHTIDDCGHCPFDDRPEQVNQVLLPFLKEHTRVGEKNTVTDRAVSQEVKRIE